MNLPNKLTVARIIMTPLFMAAMLFQFPFHYLVALILFAAASFTDMLDGKIARARNLVTNFGKFLDPLADKMLTTAAFIGFLAKGFGVGIVWALFIVLFREFMISSLRLVVVSSDKSKVIPANFYGKLKTVTQMAAIIFGLLVLTLNNEIIPFIKGTMAESVLYVCFNVLLWVSTIAAVISGVIYMKDSFEFIDPTK